MPGKPWTTDEQVVFLTKNIPHFLEAQAAKTLPAFWPRIFREWFEKFPEKDVIFPEVASLTEAQAATLQSALADRRKVSWRQCIMILHMKSSVDAADLVQMEIQCYGEEKVDSH